MRRIALWAFVVAALALVAWGTASYLHPAPQCRGEAMKPHDLCHYSSATELNTDRKQSYEQRVQTVRQQAPYAIGVGAVVAIFGIYLALSSAKAHRTVDDAALVEESDLDDTDFS